jgi:photosystem II stability/assembly factor-like uncharacterized protein
MSCTPDGTKIIAAAYSGDLSAIGVVIISTDSGNNWTQVSLPNGAWSGVACNTAFTKLYACSSGAAGNIYYSQDGGVNWSVSSLTPKWWSDIACNSDGTIAYASIGRNKRPLPMSDVTGVIYKTTDSGVSWGSLPTSGTANWTSICCSSNGNIAYASRRTWGSATGGGVYRTADQGNTWALKKSLQYDEHVDCDTTGQRVIATTGDTGSTTGAHISTDGGTTWIKSNASTSSTPVNTYCGTVIEASNKYLVSSYSAFKNLYLIDRTNATEAINQIALEAFE